MATDEPSSPMSVAPGFAPAELARAFRRPLDLLQLVLVEHARLTATAVAGARRSVLIGLLAFGSILFALPYGIVLAIDQPWRVAVLFVGSLAVCLPSLQIFGTYIGVRLDARQTVTLGLVITCVASLFTFAFFPILWFLDATMLADSEITAAHASVGFLVASLAAGIAHLFRCLANLQATRDHTLPLVAWLLLLVFVNYRLARVLGLL